MCKTAKEAWAAFFLNGEELVAFTLKEATCDEIEATVELLAYEQGCDPAEIKCKVIMR